MFKLLLVIFFLFTGCDDNTEDQGPPLGNGSYSIFVSLQGSDKVAIVGSDLEIKDIISIDLMAMDMGMMGMEAPHDIAVDDMHGYWFTTAMMGGDVGMYSIETNELISSFNIGLMPALMALDEENMKIYISRGKPDGGSTNIIYELSYDGDVLVEVEQWDVGFNYAHGINFNKDNGHVYVTSKTADFIAKIDPSQPQSYQINPKLVSMNASINPDNYTIDLNRLVPIQIATKYPYMFIACSAGSVGSLPGQIQMWNIEEMTLVETYEFDTYSHPWHIEVSSIEDEIFVTLSGSDINDPETASGVACIKYSISNNPIMEESWKTTSSNYGKMHGITVQSDCDGNYYVYSTGRTDGNIYKFDASTGEQIGASNNLADIADKATGGIDSYSPNCDCCN